MTSYTATYSPDDNKLRLYASTRLDSETYERVKAAGFKWAPKQDLFVAPMWTPNREDLCVELAGEISDEDTSLIDRAEQRADRFEDLSERRTGEAKSARDAVDAIADGIPFGQPILVGHHSERRARKDAERIQTGMRKAIALWDQAEYWQTRAKSAIRHAKYKERPDVRHRRIKTLGADLRKEQRHMLELESGQRRWNDAVAADVGPFLRAGYDFDMKRKFSAGEISAEQVIERKRNAYVLAVVRSNRWLAHYQNRIAYETAMLNDQLGSKEEQSGFSGRFDFAVGGKVLVKGEWLIILRVNKTGGAINSLTTTPPRVVTWTNKWKHGVEEVSDYQPPSEEMTKRVKKATSLPPLCNYPGEGFREMTEEEWSRRKQWSDFSFIVVVNATETAGKHRVRQMPGKTHYWQAQRVFITDAKVVHPPKPETPDEPMPRESVPMPSEYSRPAPRTFDEKIETMRKALKTGITVAVAPQLFPTPSAIARQVVELAEISTSDIVLEPSAGTGNLLEAIGPGPVKVAVELNAQLAKSLEERGLSRVVWSTDFLECTRDMLGTFDRVVMNPPFEKGADIKHIKHALTFLIPGGRLVAICANGPRQQEALRPLASEWIDLPDDSFKEQGTSVRTAIVVINKR